MLGIETFDPWIGPNYCHSTPKLLVLGESRFDEEEWTDKKIIEDKIEGSPHKTFTNFVQAALGLHHTHDDYNAQAFWKRVIFYNYNTSVFPGHPRVPLDWETRCDPQNGKVLRDVLFEYKPTHVVVWGACNWESLDVAGSPWIRNEFIPNATWNGRQHPYCAVVVEGQTTLFTYVVHPSAGFSAPKWAPVLSAFFLLKP